MLSRQGKCCQGKENVVKEGKCCQEKDKILSRRG